VSGEDVRGGNIKVGKFRRAAVRVAGVRTGLFRISLLAAGLVLLSLFGLASAKKQPPAKPIDLNAATLKELEELPGVGPVTAQRILDARQKSGRFRRVEDLLAVRGISAKRLEALRPYVSVSPPPPPPAKKK
jgi:competence ComEA-like helix-hairpin-helix protein